MLIGARTACWYGDGEDPLPQGCRRVKNIRANGNQYVETSFTPIHGSCVMTLNASISSGRCGSIVGSSNRFYFGVMNGKWGVGLGSEYNHSISVSDTYEHEFVYGNKVKFRIDNEDVFDVNYNIDSNYNSVELFAITTGQFRMTGYISRVKFEIDGEVEGNLIPIVHTEGGIDTAYFYDTITRSYENLGCAVIGRKLGWEELDGTIVPAV